MFGFSSIIFGVIVIAVVVAIVITVNNKRD